MADFIPNICGTNKVYIPIAGCDDCSKFEKRLSVVEAILQNKITISQTNRNGNSITAEVIGEVIE